MSTRVLCLILFGMFVATGIPESKRHAPGEKDQGLPLRDATWAPYHADPSHRLNRIFRAIWLAEITPAEVSAALPREHRSADEFFAVGWVHTKRTGDENDARLFGGDGRQLPRESFAAEESLQLSLELRALDAEDRLALLDPPALAVYFQHDLLRLLQRLLETEANEELIAPLSHAVRWAALDLSERDRLQDPLAQALAVDAVGEELRRRDILDLRSFDTEATEYREVLRRSTRLFDAQKTLCWSRLYLAHPQGAAELVQMLQRIVEQKQSPEVPIGFAGILIQGIVALGSDGIPYATPIVVEARTQRLRDRDGLSAAAPSFTKDGIDFEILILEREGLRRGVPQEFYRFVDPDDQELFRDYGTLKHATYRAQCSLCHRNTGTPETHLGGFPVLRPHAQPSFAATASERLRLAEAEVLKLLAELPDLKGN